MNTEQKISFWKSESKRSLEVSQTLFEAGKYVEALFFGHLALEKALKGRIIEATQQEPFYSHDLVVLAKYAQVSLSDEQRDFLARVNVYNIRARYPDYRRSLYRKATKQFAEAEMLKIEEMLGELS